jgi:hypothetical protein
MHALHAVLSVLGGKMDPKITKSLKKSLGEITDMQLTRNDDKLAWQLDMPNPLRGNKYKPFFFERGSEYGTEHHYYEALCHASSSNHRFALLPSSTARYANRKAKKSFPTVLIPATMPVTAYVDSLRQVNKPFLETLHARIGALEGINAEALDAFMEGLFRNAAIQVHFGGNSEPIERGLHLDHLHSALHMALTLNGTRDILFIRDEEVRLDHTLAEGDVYVTSPTRVMHGIHVPKCKAKEASISIQLRTLMSCATADSIYPFSDQICDIILDLLREHDGIFSLPSFDEFQQALLAIEAELTTQIASMPSKIPKTLTFDNPPM